MIEIPELTVLDETFGDTRALPAWDDIPEDFRRHNSEHPWTRIPSKWFFEGGSLAEFGLTPKEGVDVGKAMRAIKACLGSFEPKHEHKIAGVGFMLSEWFDQPTTQPTE